MNPIGALEGGNEDVFSVTSQVSLLRGGCCTSYSSLGTAGKRERAGEGGGGRPTPMMGMELGCGIRRVFEWNVKIKNKIWG